METSTPSVPKASHGPTPVPKYRAWAAKNGTPWEVRFLKTATTPYQRRYFRDEESAKKAVAAWVEGREPATVLSNQDTTTFLAAKALLPAGVSVLDAARYFIAHNPSASKTTVQEVCDYYWHSLLGMSWKYRQEQRRWIAKLKEELGGKTLFRDVTKARFVAFIYANRASEANTYARKRIASRLCYLARHEMEATSSNVLDGWKRPRCRTEKTKFFMSVENTAVFMRWVQEQAPHLVPSFALQLWAGIRTHELCRKDENGKRGLRWEDISWGKRIYVPSEVAKMSQSGWVDFWAPCLSKWMEPHREAKGRICPVLNLDDAKHKLLVSLNASRTRNDLEPVKHKQNAFRHSFATYHVAYINDEGKTRSCLRQRDRDVMWRHYINNEAEHERAVRYFETVLPNTTHEGRERPVD